MEHLQGTAQRLCEVFSNPFLPPAPPPGLLASPCLRFLCTRPRFSRALAHACVVGGFFCGTVAHGGSCHAARCAETGSPGLALWLDLQINDGAGAFVLKAVSVMTWLVISLSFCF